MSDTLPFLVIGVVNGTIYAIAAMGLTLTFKTTGVFNFAYGAVAAAAAYFFYALNDLHHVSWPIAAVVTLVVFGFGVGLIFERFGQVLSRVPAPLQIAGTVGVMVAVQAGIVLKYGSASVNFQNFLPQHTWQVGSVYISVVQVVVVATAIVLGAGLWALLRFTGFGTATRAVVDAPELLTLTGRNPGSVRRWSWLLGSAFAAASGVLSALVVGTLDPTILTLVLVQAFGAAAIGAFRNLGLSFLGGVFIGVLAALTTFWVGTNQTLSGLPTAIPFVVLVLVLLVTPRGRLVVQRAVSFRIVTPRRQGPLPLRAGLVVVGVAVVLLAPQVLGDSRVPSLTQALAISVIFLSLGVLVHLSGQISLIQYSLAAVGAAAFSRFAGVEHVPWLLALLLAGLIAVPVGAVVAIPAIRLSGLFLALATFGFGLVLQQLFYQRSIMFGSGFAIPTPRPSWASGQLAYYYLTAAVVAVCCLLVVFVTRSRLGRLLRGMAGSPTAVATHGVSLTVTKVMIFCFSAFLAGIAGALTGPVTGSLNAAPFDPFNSLTLLTVLFLAGGGMVRYAFIGGIAVVLIPSYVTNPHATSYLQVLFGVSAVVIACLGARTAHSRTPLTLIAPLTRRVAGRWPVAAAAQNRHVGAADAFTAAPPAGRPDGPGAPLREDYAKTNARVLP